MGHKILLADDSITIQKVIELTFSDEDFELHTVGNGQKAIDEIRSIMPHIVLCDIIMPEKNGYEVCEFIKSHAELKHIPVLLLTGAFEPFDQERARAAGCDGFLAKPFEPQTLISKVKELLAKTPVAAAPAAAPRPHPQPQPPVAAAPKPAPRPAPAPPPAAPARPPARPAPAPPPADVDERTVFVQPPKAAPPPPPAPRGPQVTASTPPPPPPAEDLGPGLDDAFAVEAGERELRMDPGDHTVLLGGREPRSGSSSTDSGSDDIWGEVVEPTPLEPSGPDADSSTVFMAPPPAMGGPESAPEYGEIQYEGGEDLDATWRMPTTEEPAEESPTYGGFEDFAAPAESEEDTVQAPSAPADEPVFEMPPALDASEGSTGAYGDLDPFTSSATSDASPFDSDQTIDSAVEQDTYERIPTSGFEAYEEPEIVSSAEEESAFEREPEAAAEPFDELEAPTNDVVSGPEPSGFQEFDASDFETASSEPSDNSSGHPSSVAIDDDLIEKVAQRVVDKLSEKVIQEIAWEVVPDLAEGLIRREIEALKAKIPK
jgi:CheY-like chemotaxis protein